MVNVLIVQADQQEAIRIQELLKSSKQHFNCFCADNAHSALNLIDEHKMELIIIDIDLPGLTFAQQIRQIPCCKFAWIVLLSKDNHYEIEAYRTVHCYDFLVKPCDEYKLLATIEMLSRFRVTSVTDEDRAVVTFKYRDQYLRIPARDILYFEVAGNNSTLYTYSEQYELKKTSLKKIKMMLPGYFVQCHKSFVVNRNYISAIQKERFGWEIRLKDFARSIPSGDKYKENVTGFQA